MRRKYGRMDLATISASELDQVQDQLRTRLKNASSLETAAQTCVQMLIHAFQQDIVLARVFITLPFGSLPEVQRRHVWNIVERQSLQAQMSATTPVLTLLGTSGREPAWCQRQTSQGHAAIPLCSTSFVDSIPMIARMLHQMGVNLNLSDASDTSYAEQILGAGWVGLFYVDDARFARDQLGRRVIPAESFVDQYQVRTVFGLGKAYSSGSIATLVVFTNTRVSKKAVEDLIPVMNLFKAATTSLINQSMIWSSTS
jgi:hypothetical protein